ncbi:MAG: LysM peptidoglycan-binding domain-containing protein [Lacunisphaera sp.]
MKNFRLLATTLFAALVVTFAPGQQRDEIAALRAKAEKGNSVAQYNLGLAYAEGRGIAADKIEAYVWLSLARESGTRGHTLDTLIASLDKDSLTAARQRLADQKALISGNIPVVTTAKSDPDVVTTVKTTSAADLSPDTVAVSKETPDSSAQFASLTADKRQLSEELAKAWKEIEGLTTALKKARIEAKTAKSSASSAADQENAAKFSRELEASLNRVNDEKAQLEQSLSATQVQLASAKAALAIQTDKNEKLAAAAAASLTPSAEMAALRSKIGDAQAQITTLTTTLAAERASETNLRDSVAQLQQEKTQLASKPDLSGKVSALEAQLASAAQNVESATRAAEAANKQSAADASASAAEIQRLQTALAAKPNTPAYPDLSGKVRDLEATVADANQKLAAADGAQSELQQKLTAANAVAQSAIKSSSEIAKLQLERDELKNHANSLADENTQLRAKAEHVQKLLADSGKQLQDTAEAAKRTKELAGQTTELKSSLASATAQVASLQQSLAAKSAAPAYPDLSHKVRELETKLTAVNQQADAAVQTAVNASRQNTIDLNNASAKLAQLEAQLAAKNAAPAPADLSGRVQELEKQLANASAETDRAKQEAVALGRARDEALKNRGPSYPNLAGRVVELQTALADTKRDLSDAQSALQTAQQARETALAAAPVAPIAPVASTDTPHPSAATSDLQKQLAETENKLTTALRGYALLQNDRDAQVEKAAKAAEAVTNERNTLSTQVATLTDEVEKLKAQGSTDVAAAKADAVQSSESLGALQRSTAKNSNELVAARALIQQLQGSNTVLANENYLLKTKLSPGPVAVPTTASVTPVPAVANVTHTHVVVSGDTLFRISQRYYGTTNRWQEIYKANAAKLGTNGVLRIGMELTIP